MKWNVKKTGYLFLLVLTAAVTGCSQDRQGENDTLSEVLPLTWFSDVSFWHPPEDWDCSEDTVQGVLTQKTGLTFEMEIPPEDAETKLSWMLANGELPDIISITDEKMIDKLTASGEVWRMDEFLETYDPDSHLLKDFPGDIKEGLTERDGGWYALPSHLSSEDNRARYAEISTFYQELQKYHENNAVIINEQLMEASGITLEELKTETGFVQALQKVKSMGLSVNGKPVIPLLYDGNAYQESSLPFLQMNFGAVPVNDERHYQDILRDPNYKHALHFMNRTIREGYADMKQLTMDNSEIKKLFSEERVFAFIGNIANTGYDSSLCWISPGAIYSDTGASPVYRKNFRNLGWIQTFISKENPYPGETAKFLSYVTSEEGLMLLFYGIEGKDYTLDAAGKAIRAENGEKREETGLNIYWPFVNTDWSYTVMPEPDPDTRSGKSQIMTKNAGSAYVLDERTEMYDASLVNLSDKYLDFTDGEEETRENLEAYKKKLTAQIVTAPDEESVEALYREMLDTMDGMGLPDIEKKTDQKMQECSQRMQGDACNGE